MLMSTAPQALPSHDERGDNAVADGVSEPILVRAFDYWRNVDKDIGDRIEKATRDLLYRQNTDFRTEKIPTLYRQAISGYFNALTLIRGAEYRPLLPA